MENQFVANTIVLESSIAEFHPVDAKGITLNLSGDTLQRMLQNITISLLTMGNAIIKTNVTTTNYVNKYQFGPHYELVAPYVSALVFALLFAILGSLALVQNGVSATEGGFLQLLCTTRGSSVLDEKARAGCLGGEENVPEELQNLLVRFGELRNGEGVRAGFGVSYEVQDLVKGRNYG